MLNRGTSDNKDGITDAGLLFGYKKIDIMKAEINLK